MVKAYENRKKDFRMDLIVVVIILTSFSVSCAELRENHRSQEDGNAKHSDSSRSAMDSLDSNNTLEEDGSLVAMNSQSTIPNSRENSNSTDTQENSPTQPNASSGPSSSATDNNTKAIIRLTVSTSKDPEELVMEYHDIFGSGDEFGLNIFPRRNKGYKIIKASKRMKDQMGEHNTRVPIRQLEFHLHQVTPVYKIYSGHNQLTSVILTREGDGCDITVERADSSQPSAKNKLRLQCNKKRFEINKINRNFELFRSRIVRDFFGDDPSITVELLQDIEIEFSSFPVYTYSRYSMSNNNIEIKLELPNKPNSSLGGTEQQQVTIDNKRFFSNTRTPSYAPYCFKNKSGLKMVLDSSTTGTGFLTANVHPNHSGMGPRELLFELGRYHISAKAYCKISYQSQPSPHPLHQIFPDQSHSAVIRAHLWCQPGTLEGFIFKERESNGVIRRENIHLTNGVVTNDCFDLQSPL